MSQSTMSDEDVITMLQGMILSLANIPEKQRDRIRWKIIDDAREHNTKQHLMSVGLILDSVNVMMMDNFNEVINRAHPRTAVGGV